jgi:NADH:ubiquinone oxidoreductase subunit E
MGKGIIMIPEITICMGSSCFARGNEENLQTIEKYLKANGLTVEVKLKGSCCEGYCAKGPNLVINGKIYHHVEQGILIDLLNEKLLFAE